MLNDEQVKNMIYERSIEKFKNNVINEKVLNDVLDYIESNYGDFDILRHIMNNEKSSYFSRIENGISRLENVILKHGNASYIYYFAIDVKGANIEKLEDAIIKAGNFEYIKLFAKKVHGANVEKIEDSVISTNNAERIYEFAIDVKDANIEKLEDAIIATKDSEYIYKFAMNVKEANIEKLEDALISLRYAHHYIYEFAKNVKGANIEKLENAIITTKDMGCIYKFAKDIEGANIEKLENIIVENKDPFYICEFAKEIGYSPKLEDAIIATKDARYIYDFAKSVYGANIGKLEKAMIKTKNIDFICKFAGDIRGANIGKLENTIIKLGDEYGIIQFAMYVKGANIEKLEDAIISNALETIGDSQLLKKLEEDILKVNYVRLKNKIETLCSFSTVNIIKQQQNRICKLLNDEKYKDILYRQANDEIGYATKILINGQNSMSLLNDLIDNSDKEDNLLKLKIYGEFLIVNMAKILNVVDMNDETILNEAIKLDDEYENQLQKEKQKIKK